MKKLLLMLFISIPALLQAQYKKLKMPESDPQLQVNTYLFDSLQTNDWEAIHLYRMEYNGGIKYSIFYDNAQRKETEPVELKIRKQEFQETKNGTYKLFIVNFKNSSQNFYITFDWTEMGCLVTEQASSLATFLPFTKHFYKRYINGKEVSTTK